jgi:hypothetical protein
LTGRSAVSSIKLCQFWLPDLCNILYCFYWSLLPVQ